MQSQWGPRIHGWGRPHGAAGPLGEAAWPSSSVPRDHVNPGENGGGEGEGANGEHSPAPKDLIRIRFLLGHRDHSIWQPGRGDPRIPWILVIPSGIP